MRLTKEQSLWADRNSLEDDDILEDISYYCELLKFNKYNIRIVNGELALVVSKGISSYALIPCAEKMCITIWKRDDLSQKDENKFFFKKDVEDIEDGYMSGLSWISRGKNI